MNLSLDYCSCSTSQPQQLKLTRHKQTQGRRSYRIATLAFSQAGCSRPWDARNGNHATRRPARTEVFVALSKDVLGSSNRLGAYSEVGLFLIEIAPTRDLLWAVQALSSIENNCTALKNLKVMGVRGISVEIHWGLVESDMGVFDWGGYRALLGLIADYGFKIKVSLCFHSTDTIPLPRWLQGEQAEGFKDLVI